MPSALHEACARARVQSAQAMVAATVRTIFEQPERTSAAAQLRHVCDVLAARFPAVVQLVEEAETEVLTFYDFPVERRRQVYSTLSFLHARRTCLLRVNAALAS